MPAKIASSTVGPSTVAIGKKVPGFSRPVTGGGVWKLSAAAGSNLVLYFYPRDNTAGCTAQGAAFSELHAKFAQANTLIVGISADTIASHEKFKAKMAFPFELLADEDHEVAGLFGVYKEKSMYGRQFMGIERSTFLLDGKGVLRQEWRKVRVPGHADVVLAAAKAL